MSPLLPAQPLTPLQRQRLVRVARGLEPADLCIQGSRVVSPLSKEIFESDVLIAEGHIAAFGSGPTHSVFEARGRFLAPGLIDAHIHIESSLLTPQSFAQAVLPRGTTTVIAEPHEIVNVQGLSGLHFMQESGQRSGMRVFLSAPSCVPASPFERGGAEMGADEIEQALGLSGVLGLAEMMNYPGVLNADPKVWSILERARSVGAYRLDGHGAGLTGRELMAYACAGIHSDHEAINPLEAQERLRAGLWLMVREGSAARNLEALLPVLKTEPRRAMLVSDDVEVLELLELGHLDRILRAAVVGGLEPLYALSLVTSNPAEYWGLHDLGAVAPGFRADLVLLEDLVSFKAVATFVGGECVWEEGNLDLDLGFGAAGLREIDLQETSQETSQEISQETSQEISQTTFQTTSNGQQITNNGKQTKTSQEILQEASNKQQIKQQITNNEQSTDNGQRITDNGKHNVHLGPDWPPASFEPDPNLPVIGVQGEQIVTLHLPAGSPDTLKLVVIERHNSSFTRAATALASGIGLHKGALGTTFLHDAHNLIVAGVTDSDILLCAETIAQMGGGIALVADGEVLARLPLPVAGLMSPLHPLEVANLQRALEGEAQKLGCILPHPLTTLAFLGLTVIPSLKLTPEGLFDVVKFERVTP